MHIKLSCQYINRKVQKVSERYISALQVPPQSLPQQKGTESE